MVVKPLVSVILPIYKVEKYLRVCIDSLLSQDYPSYEIILVDDGSPDSCGLICDEYAAKYTFVQVVHQSNAGVSAARNAGMRMAKGDYICFVDPDDWVDPDYLTILTEHMTQGGMAVGDLVNERGSPVTENLRNGDRKGFQTVTLGKVGAQQSVLYQDGNSHIYCGACCKLFDKRIIENHSVYFSEDLIFYEDELFVIQYLSYIRANVVWSRAAIYHRRIHLDSSSHQLRKLHCQFDYKLFSEVTAHERELNYVQCAKETMRLLAAKQAGAKLNALQVMAMNGWNDLKYWKLYLQDIRAGLFSVLLCDCGMGIRGKVSLFLCAIHPRLEHLVRTLWTAVKKHTRYNSQ